MEEANSDPLSLLRRYNLDKKEIIEEGDVIRFGKYYWPKNVDTNYFKRGCGKDNAKEYYTLECLVNFLKHVNLPHPEYVQQAVAKGIAAVRRPDRKDLLKYLNGEMTTSTNIDPDVPVVIAQVRSEDRLCDAELPESETKKSIPEMCASLENKDNANTDTRMKVARESEEPPELKTPPKKQRLEDESTEIVNNKQKLDADSKEDEKQRIEEEKEQ